MYEWTIGVDEEKIVEDEGGRGGGAG